MSKMKQLEDGTSFTKATYYEGETLKKVYRKVDGVPVMRNASNDPVSRAGKPLFNVGYLNFKDAEVYTKDWNTFVSIVRSQSYQLVTQDMIYELNDGEIDSRLLMEFVDINDYQEIGRRLEASVYRLHNTLKLPCFAASFLV